MKLSGASARPDRHTGSRTGDRKRAGRRTRGEPCTLTGRVFDISRASVDDGPGLRTVVYLKGCPLDCGWCHNPEGKRFEREIAFHATRCRACGECVPSCPPRLLPSIADVNPPGCNACGACVSTCLAGARRLVGRDLTVGELLAEVLVDREFFVGSGGGVTFSGGEPTSQGEFLFAASKALGREGIHVAIETCGQAPNELFRRLAEVVDVFLFDLKLVSPVAHAEHTGVENGRILGNLMWMLANGVEIQVRVPLVPGVNLREDELDRMAGWLAAAPRRPQIMLLPFHRLGRIKCEQLGRPYPFAEHKPPARAEVERARTIVRKAGLDVVV